MKVIIAGSRSITDYRVIIKAIANSGFVLSEIVSGAARGVDQLGEQYARLHNIPIKLFPADWAKYGRGAGMLRNEEMGRYADALIAVWDGSSRGTKYMIQFMQGLKKPVFVLTDPIPAPQFR